MITVENELFTIIAEALREKYKNIYITGDPIRAPSKFPCVMIYEADNSIDTRMISSSNVENGAVLLYMVDVYSDRTNGRKQECKAILDVVDNIMKQFNFTRLNCGSIDNLRDESIMRYTARYQAVADKNKTLYRY